MSSNRISLSIAITVCVIVGLLCVGLCIHGVVERKRAPLDLERGYVNGDSAEELSTQDSQTANASPGSGSGSSGYEADVSDGDEQAGRMQVSHCLSTIPEERLSQLSEPEPSHVREVDHNVAAGAEAYGPSRATRKSCSQLSNDRRASLARAGSPAVNKQ